MYSVTRRIKSIKQPRGGYIPRKQFSEIQLDDKRTLNDVENIHATLVGLAVDYLTRWAMGTDYIEAFKISILGAKQYDAIVGGDRQLRNVVDLLSIYMQKHTIILDCPMI